MHVSPLVLLVLGSGACSASAAWCECGEPCTDDSGVSGICADDFETCGNFLVAPDCPILVVDPIRTTTGPSTSYLRPKPIYESSEVIVDPLPPTTSSLPPKPIYESPDVIIDPLPSTSTHPPQIAYESYRFGRMYSYFTDWTWYHHLYDTYYNDNSYNDNSYNDNIGTVEWCVDSGAKNSCDVKCELLCPTDNNDATNVCAQRLKEDCSCAYECIFTSPDATTDATQDIVSCDKVMCGKQTCADVGTSGYSDCPQCSTCTSVKCQFWNCYWPE